jgi:hypothetical protein
MPAVNSKILTADYNDIRNKLVSILGTGSGTQGWGQAARINSTAVSESNKVTVNEWANLRFDIINAYRHINGSNPTMAVPASGNTIRYTSSFTPDTGTLDVPQKQYDDWMNNIIANRFTVAAGESALTAAISASKTDSWNGNISCTIGFYFNNANEARWFFNSGGQIRISASRSGGTTSPQNSSWTSLLNTIGTQLFGGNNPGSGTTPSDGTNWYRCTNSFQTFYTASASSPYGANSYQLQARVTDVANNSTGTAAYGEIRVLFNDGYVDPALLAVGTKPFPPDYDEFGDTDLVDGTLTVSVSTLYATGIMVPSSQTFSVAGPTVGVGAISSAYTPPALATLNPPSIWFDDLGTYMRGYLNEFKNPDFYVYALDGTDNYGGDIALYDQYIKGGSNFITQGTWMFDLTGNLTLPISRTGAAVSSPSSVPKYLNQIPAARQASVIRYEVGRNLQVVDTDCYYKTSGYSDTTQYSTGFNSLPANNGGLESRPLFAMMYRPGTNVWHGWEKIGETESPNNLGTVSTGYIYQNSTYNGFTVVAWHNQIYGATKNESGFFGGTITYNMAAVCDLHITIGHPRWGSNITSYNVYSNLAAFPGTGNAMQNNYLAVNGTNLVSATLLLSKVYPNGVTNSELTNVVNAWVNRVAAYFNF